MESSSFSEAVGSVRVCAELVAGELAIDIFAYMNTECGTACCKSTQGNGAEGGRVFSEIALQYSIKL